MPDLLDLLDQLLPQAEKFECKTHGISTVITLHCADCDLSMFLCAQCMANSSCARDEIKEQLRSHADECEKGSIFLDVFKW